MKNREKIFSAGIVFSMTCSMVWCEVNCANNNAIIDSTQNMQQEMISEDSDSPIETDILPNERRTINIGSWCTQYYDSSHESVKVDLSYFGQETADLKFANVASIEKKYNCEFYWKNLTYEGVQESINDSIRIGEPDCDIYLVDLSFGIPAALNGLALDLKTVLSTDNDLFTTQNNVKYIDLGDGKASILKRVEATSTVEATYPLAFNKQILEANNLEDPRILYKNGEWTWGKFLEYCQILTQDTDGDGQIDQYGYCGYINETFEQLLMSNGANVASGKTQEISTTETGEVLQMISDMYHIHQVCYPYEFESGNDAIRMRGQYRQGNIAFFPISAGIAAEEADYDYNGAKGCTLDFDTVYVQWPVGPSGDATTNAGKISAGEYYMIANGVENPEIVYNVLYDMWNWYDGDTSIRDNEEALFWWYAVTAKELQLQKENFNVMYEMGSRETFELWNNLGIEYDWTGLMNGEVTPEQFQERYKNQIQNALDVYFNS